MEKNQRQALLSWLSVMTLLVLCGTLGYLQYRWIGEVSFAARERLRANLQAGLDRLSRDFNTEITTACLALLPQNLRSDGDVTEADYAARYARWKQIGRDEKLFRRVAVAKTQDGSVALRLLDMEAGVFKAAEWPAGWSRLKERLELRLEARPSPDHWQNRHVPGPPMPGEELLFELPRFARPPEGSPFPFGRRETEWLIIELNPGYISDVILPGLVQRDLGTGDGLDYHVEVVSKAAPPSIIYRSDHDPERIVDKADASVSLLELQYDRIFRRSGPPGMRERGPGRTPMDMGRWQMFVRHRAGSLEAAVSRAQWRNLAVIAGILLLMVATVAALVRFTRRAQKLAELQMEFVASVSHELRTPLTVIRTAAYNLRGRLANNPVQVERYGSLIQQESERLTDLVEQVLRFANAKAGRLIREPEPLAVESVIEDSVESSKAVIDGARFKVETTIEPELPLILGDATALKHVLNNLLSNAAKYGTEGNDWIGVFASKSTDRDQPVVEIRVADRGPGIPLEEQEHIFDPFFRGRRALQDQIHGTGLGLSLVKGIVEAHGGRIVVRSGPGKGTEFVVRIPAAPPEYQDEFAHSVD